jgi:hypothetical protein
VIAAFRAYSVAIIFAVLLGGIVVLIAFDLGAMGR